MGKDREGKFHPKKAKPSGPIKAEASGLKSINTQSIEHNFEIADKYTTGEEDPAPNVHVRHPNRNVDKQEEKQFDKFDFKNNKARKETFKEDTGASTIPSQEIKTNIT